jgi:hypothetical protein
MTYRLSIHKIEQSCLFDLTWNRGQRLTASLPYPPQLTRLYDEWRRTYLGYYKQGMRGRTGAIGAVVSAKVDWHSQVVQTEARFLSEFHKWLKDGALFDLRAELSQAAVSPEPTPELFLTCTPLEVARLPWETWEVSQNLQIVRSPAMIQSEPVKVVKHHPGKVRVLAILGDETGLNFQGERQALNAQGQVLEIHYVGWQPEENLDPVALKERICQKIAEPPGWDILFFAGHSNEETVLAGRIAIAPHATLSIKELSPYLQQAQHQGLQFALFNSCSGLDIANGVINLGLSQVAIMREPIHNEVAQTFLVQFLQRLARYENVQEALRGACQFLKIEKHLTYPSAYLVPSLFRHPESEPYRLVPRGWRSHLRPWLPTQREAIALGALVLLSLLPPVQTWLLTQRQSVQARYRHAIAQVLPSRFSGVETAFEEPPAVILVQIDDRTLREQQILSPNPIDRNLLAELVDTLTQWEANIIGLDYVLDRPQPQNDPVLRASLEGAIAQRQSWLILAARRSHLGEWLSASTSLVSPQWSLQGDIWTPNNHIRPRGWSDARPFPFSYQAALAYKLAQLPPESDVPQPRLDYSESLQSWVASYLEETQDTPLMSSWSILHPITSFFYPFHQRWLQPLLDFSLPPDQVYVRIPAWQLLQDPAQVLADLNLASLQNRVVLIAPGGYDEAGFSQGGEDNLELPGAIAFWRRQNPDQGSLSGFTGGEIHGYMAHHFIHDHLVIPLPDLWLVLLAALLGKGLCLRGLANWKPPARFHLLLAGGILGYGLLSLQIYVSAAILLPWLLPALTLAFYGVEARQKP